MYTIGYENVGPYYFYEYEFETSEEAQAFANLWNQDPCNRRVVVKRLPPDTWKRHEDYIFNMED